MITPTINLKRVVSILISLMLLAGLTATAVSATDNPKLSVEQYLEKSYKDFSDPEVFFDIQKNIPDGAASFSLKNTIVKPDGGNLQTVPEDFKQALEIDKKVWSGIAYTKNKPVQYRYVYQLLKYTSKDGNKHKVICLTFPTGTEGWKKLSGTYLPEMKFNTCIFASYVSSYMTAEEAITPIYNSYIGRNSLRTNSRGDEAISVVWVVD